MLLVMETLKEPIVQGRCNMQYFHRIPQIQRTKIVIMIYELS
jgi:hypothetical protein